MFCTFVYKKRVFRLKAEKASGIKKFFGLMFKKRENAKALIFILNKPLAIHSFFVFFPFISVWMHKNKVVAVKKIKPFKFHVKPKEYFDKIIEIPFNKKYDGLIHKLINKAGNSQNPRHSL